MLFRHSVIVSVTGMKSFTWRIREDQLRKETRHDFRHDGLGVSKTEWKMRRRYLITPSLHLMRLSDVRYLRRARGDAYDVAHFDGNGTHERHRRLCLPPMQRVPNTKPRLKRLTLEYAPSRIPDETGETHFECSDVKRIRWSLYHARCDLEVPAYE